MSFAIFSHGSTVMVRFVLSASLCTDYFVCVCFGFQFEDIFVVVIVSEDICLSPPGFSVLLLYIV